MSPLFAIIALVYLGGILTHLLIGVLLQRNDISMPPRGVSLPMFLLAWPLCPWLLVWIARRMRTAAEARR